MLKLTRKVLWKSVLLLLLCWFFLAYMLNLHVLDYKMSEFHTQ